MKKTPYLALTTICLSTFIGTSFGLSGLQAKEFRPNAVAKAAAATISAEEFRGHIRFLASDLLEGRGVATRGDELTQAYIAAQFEALGLKPAGLNGTYLQPLVLNGITSAAPEFWTITHQGKSLTLKRGADFVAGSSMAQPTSGFQNAELVFVGYGIQAPEFQWDDYKGVDLTGKVLLMLNNDPANDPNQFAGKGRLYYGRWIYKYEMAKKMGAAGAIIIHTEESAAYPWQVVQTSWNGEQTFLKGDSSADIAVRLWTTETASKDLVALGGHDLANLTAQAQQRDFKPVPLGVKLSMTIKNKVRNANTANVIGLLPGSDSQLAKEAIVYSAHHDHLGVKVGGKPGEDVIYNGAFDNASGVAGILTMARAFKSLKVPSKRSLLFLATAAEESGKLGAAYYVQNPTWPLAKMAANINLDGVTHLGQARDIIMIGKGKSSLDAYADAIATYQKRVLLADQFPERGSFYRADQFEFAKVGVPAAYFKEGIDIVGKPAGWGKITNAEWVKRDYHQPSDELNEHWDFVGAVLDLQFFFYLGLEVGNAPQMPVWNRGDEFEAVRLRSLKQN